MMVARSRVGFAQEADGIIGEEFAIEHQEGFAVPFFLVKEFLKLVQKAIEIGAEKFAPGADARVGDSEEAHENMRAPDAVPAGVARQFEGLA